MESPSKMAVSFFKYFGFNVEDSVHAQMPMLTPALGAPMDVEGVASMEGARVLQDSLQKFKKEFEDVQGEYFAGMARASRNLVDSLRGAQAVDIQAVDRTVRFKMFEGMKELYGNAQRKVLKAFEDEMKWFSNGPAEAGAPLLPASTGVGEAEAPKLPAKPAGITVVSTTASTSGVDAVPPAATRRRARRKRKSTAVPFVTKGPASDIKHGTIVGVNHGKKFAFIRTSHDTTDFYVGQRQYHHGMAIGDEVSFCELEHRGRRRRCPEAYHVDLLARAWTWYHRPYGARKRSTGL